MPHRSFFFCIAVVAVLIGLSRGKAFAQDDVSLPDQPTTSTAQLTPDDSAPAEQEFSAEDILAKIPPEEVAAGKAALAEFAKLKKQLVSSLSEMRATHIRYLNDEDRTPDALDRYREHRNQSRDLMNQMFESGLEVVRFIPDKEVLQYLMTVIEHRLLRDYYDASSMEVGAILLDSGFRNTFIFVGTLRAAIVNGDFELARKLIKVLDPEKLDELDQKLIFFLDELEEQYKADQEIQKLDDEKNNNPRVKMVTTRGELTIELFINQAPSTVSNFIQLVEKGYYDGLDFHQVIEHLLALTGDESGTGEGNTGKFLMDEHNRPDARQGLAGSLVMAKHPLGEGQFVPNSASAQFAILLLPITTVTENQTVFGRVIDGLDVISELRHVDPSKKKEKNAIVLPPDRVLSMTMIRRPEKLPEVKYFDPTQAHVGHSHGPIPSTGN